jgi:hypothetical protein
MWVYFGGGRPTAALTLAVFAFARTGSPWLMPAGDGLAWAAATAPPVGAGSRSLSTNNATFAGPLRPLLPSATIRVSKERPKFAFAALQALQFFDDAKRPLPVEPGRRPGRQHVDPLPQILQIERIEHIAHLGRSSDSPLCLRCGLVTWAFRHFGDRSLAA